MNPDQDEKPETKIPDFLLKLADGCSTHAELAGKYWIACALVSIVVLSVHGPAAEVELPGGLPKFSKADFFPFSFVIIAVLVTVFGSATAQAIRARLLINRFIYDSANEMIFRGNIYLPDIIDAILYPAINRVAPLAQVFQGKALFFPEAKFVKSQGRKRVLMWYYAILKSLAACVLYGLPTFALGYAVFMNYQLAAHLSVITKALLWVAGPLAFITIVTLIVMDFRYTRAAIKKIGLKKIKKVKEV